MGQRIPKGRGRDSRRQGRDIAILRLPQDCLLHTATAGLAVASVSETGLWPQPCSFPHQKPVRS